MATINELPIEMIKEIYANCGPYTRAKAALVDPRIREVFLDTPPLNQDQYDEIERYIEYNYEITNPIDIIIALKYLAPFKSELDAIVKIYAQKAADLIKGKTPQQIRDTFNITNEPYK